MKACPKCRKKTDAGKCDTCNISFKEYEQEKMKKTGQVYQLISGGKLQEAKDLAEKLSLEFPDSRGDFVLLISNINRDLNIAGKYGQAKELFNQGDYSQTALLLRNIKAFDPGLEEKVISLRRKAERHNEYTEKLERAIELFENRKYGAAKELFSQIHDHQKQDKVDEYLSRLNVIREELINEVVDSLSANNFKVAQGKFDEVLAIFPDAEQDYVEIAVIFTQKNKINGNLLAAAHKAREEGRLVEAKVIYSFLSWQSQEIQAQLLPYIDEIGSDIIINLADCAQADMVDFTTLGIQVRSDGFLTAVSTRRHGERIDAHLTKIDLVHITPEPLADMPCELVPIDGQEVADFA